VIEDAGATFHVGHDVKFHVGTFWSVQLAKSMVINSRASAAKSATSLTAGNQLLRFATVNFSCHRLPTPLAYRVSRWITRTDRLYMVHPLAKQYDQVFCPFSRVLDGRSLEMRRDQSSRAALDIPAAQLSERWQSSAKGGETVPLVTWLVATCAANGKPHCGQVLAKVDLVRLSPMLSEGCHRIPRVVTTIRIQML